MVVNGSLISLFVCLLRRDLDIFLWVLGFGSGIRICFFRCCNMVLFSCYGKFVVVRMKMSFFDFVNLFICMRSFVLSCLFVLCLLDFFFCVLINVLILFKKIVFGVKWCVSLNNILISFFELFCYLFIMDEVEMLKNVVLYFVVIVFVSMVYIYI